MHHPRSAAQALVSIQNGGAEAGGGDTAKTIRVFHLRTWSNNQRMPHTPAVLVELLSQVEHWRGHSHAPTLVVSRLVCDGVAGELRGVGCSIAGCLQCM